MTLTSHRTSEHLLDIKNINLTLGGNIILRDVNASITRADNAGEVVCFLGPSGIGKTQLSRIIAGLQVPTSGEVIFADGKPTGPGRACMVPQAYPMFDYMTVEDNLIVAGEQGGLKGDQIHIKIDELQKQFGLWDHLHKFPAALSGGTKQRVAIARQLMCATKYMVMDEPFSGLDPIMKKAAARAIINLAKLDTYGVTIVVTHDIKTGLAVSDQVWLMGLEKDAGGAFLTGARLVETYDLAAMGLAWTPDITTKPDFNELVAHIEAKFDTLR